MECNGVETIQLVSADTSFMLLLGGDGFSFWFGTSLEAVWRGGKRRIGFPALLYVEGKFKFLCTIRRGNGAQTKTTVDRKKKQINKQTDS